MVAASWLATLVAGLGVPAAAPCGALRPGVKPVLEIAADERRAPLALYAIGFSPSGHFAWLERRRAVNREKIEWSVHILDLVSDHFLAERWFETHEGGDVATVCEKYGATIALMLDRQAIQTVPAIAFEPVGPAGDLTGFDLRPGLPDADTGKTPYDVILRSRAGVKRLGSVLRVDISAGEPPLSEPQVRGMLRNPFERRVAVFVLQNMVGTEGIEIPVVKVLGGRLDKGFVQNP
jgi:hypothetical protein